MMTGDETQPKWSVHVRDGLPKATIDSGDVCAVTLRINAVTFSSRFGGIAGRAAGKDGYESCHKGRKESRGSLSRLPRRCRPLGINSEILNTHAV